ncbi:MAG: aminopeptidase P N-terminal domain-containing protein [bacterium]
MIRRLTACALLLPAALAAQTQQEYAGRRADLAAKLPDGAFIALGGHEPAQDYLSFEQAPSFYYLTGFKEPDAALLMIKQDGAVRSATMFVRPRQPSREVWTGTRIGVDGIGALTGIRGRVATDLGKVLDSLAGAGLAFAVVGDVGTRDADDEGAAVARSADEQVFDPIRKKHASMKVTSVNQIVEQLRGRKSAAELTQIRNAVDITVRAQKEAIPSIKPGMNEFEVQALIEYTFRRNGADRPSFSTIVGSGPNATTLHYNQNDRFMEFGDLVVMDIGASFKGYAADVTRTVPVSGTFTAQQRAVYQIVRDAQAAAERQATLGNAARLMTDSSNAVLAAGLTRLGLIESPNATYDCVGGAQPRQCAQFRLFYMHGIGHGIGLEVHDHDQYYDTGRIQPGSAFTIEPGIYVREHLLDEIPDTPRNREYGARIRAALASYKNIGVRIEDNYIATAQGIEWLSQGAPREMNDIEALMKQGSTGVAARDEFRVEKYRMTP